VKKNEYLVMPNVKSGNWVPFKEEDSLVFLSSQTGNTDSYSDDAKIQIQQTFDNFDVALKEAGVKREEVVQVTLRVSDRYYLKEVVRLKNEFFKEPFPATICLIQEFGHPNHIVNLSGVAYKG